MMMGMTLPLLPPPPPLLLFLACVCPFPSWGVRVAGPPPPTPIMGLALAIGGSSSLPCPPGMQRIQAGHGWDSDFNDGAGGDYVYLCAGTSPSTAPVSDLRAVVTATSQPTGACPDGYEQIAGNMNSKSSKNHRFVYLCASRNTSRPALVGLAGEKASTGCSPGTEAVATEAGSAAFNFDAAGVGVVLCQTKLRANISRLALAIGGSSSLPCPPGMQRIQAGHGWDSDFNDGAGGDYVYLCAGTSPSTAPVSDLRAVVTATSQPTGACPDGYEQIAGNMNSKSSKNHRFVYLCASRNTSRPALVGLAGEKASTGCSPGTEAVATEAGSAAFNFDAAGVGVVLCMERSRPGPCPSTPTPRGPITALVPVIAVLPSQCCPRGLAPSPRVRSIPTGIIPD
jgi:hypothetical protein